MTHYYHTHTHRRVNAQSPAGPAFEHKRLIFKKVRKTRGEVPSKLEHVLKYGYNNMIIKVLWTM